MDSYVDVVFNKTFLVNDTLSYDEVAASERAHEAVIVPVAFFVILLVGLTGNGTVLFLVSKYRELKTVPYMLIVNLAVADILVIVVCVPFTSTIYAMESWLFGTAICKLNEFLQTVVVSVSILTLSALSVERYQTIVQHDRGQRRDVIHNRRHVIRIVIVTWVLGVLFGLPDLVSANVVKYERGSAGPLEICIGHPTPANASYNKTITMTKFLLLFLVPVGIIVVSYSLLVCKLFSGDLPAVNGASYSMEHHDKQLVDRVAKKGNVLERRLHLAKVVFFLVALFVVCWLPRHIYLLWFHYSDQLYNEFWHVFKITGFCLTFVNSALNPVVVYLLDALVNRYVNRHLFCCVHGADQSGELQPLGDDDIELSVVPDASPSTV